MKMTYGIEGGVIRIRQEGEFDVDVFIATLVRVVADPAYRPAMPVLADVTQMRSQVDFAGMEKIRGALMAGALAAFRPRRYAIYTPAPMYDVMARLYSEVIVAPEPSLAGRIEIRNFPTEVEALAWVRASL